MSFALSFGDVALLVTTGGGAAGDFDTDGIEVTFEEEADGRVVDFTFEGCAGLGSWSGGESASTLSIAGDIDCSAVVPTARDAETGEDLSAEFATLQMAPFTFEWT